MADVGKKELKSKYLSIDELMKEYSDHSDVAKVAKEHKKFDETHGHLIKEDSKFLLDNFYTSFKNKITEKLGSGDFAKVNSTKTYVKDKKDLLEKSLVEIAEEELKQLDKKHYDTVIQHLTEDERKDHVLEEYSKYLGFDPRETNLLEFIKQHAQNNSTIQELLDNLYQHKNDSNTLLKSMGQRSNPIMEHIYKNITNDDVIGYIHTEVPKKGFDVNMGVLYRHNKYKLIPSVVLDHLENKLDEKKHKQYGITGSYETKK